MDDSDAFFTLTIVGAPFSALLGRRTSGRPASGIDVGLADGRTDLGETWRDKLLLGRANDRRGQPLRRPGPWLRWAERHALVIALLGLAAIAASGAVIGVRLWN